MNQHIYWLRLSSHASMYQFHLPQLFFRQVWYLPGSLSGGSDILLFFILVLQVRVRTKERTGRLHDMSVACFRP